MKTAMDELAKAKSIILAQQLFIENLKQHYVEFREWLVDAGFDIGVCNCGNWINQDLDYEFLHYIWCDSHKKRHYFCSSQCLEENWKNWNWQDWCGPPSRQTLDWV